MRETRRRSHATDTRNGIGLTMPCSRVKPMTTPWSRCPPTDNYRRQSSGTTSDNDLIHVALVNLHGALQLDDEPLRLYVIARGCHRGRRYSHASVTRVVPIGLLVR